jgi:hypothetical protein
MAPAHADDSALLTAPTHALLLFCRQPASLAHAAGPLLSSKLPVLECLLPRRSHRSTQSKLCASPSSAERVPPLPSHRPSELVRVYASSCSFMASVVKMNTELLLIHGTRVENMKGKTWGQALARSCREDVRQNITYSLTNSWVLLLVLNGSVT